MTLAIIPVGQMPEVRPGDDLAQLIVDGFAKEGGQLRHGDVLAVAQKVVSKVEGRVIGLADVTAGEEARRLAEEHGKDPRLMELVLRESHRIVIAEGAVVICETRHGFVCANAGVDRSNAGEPDAAVLLPLDPDASAARLRTALREAARVNVAVVVTDTASLGGKGR